MLNRNYRYEHNRSKIPDVSVSSPRILVHQTKSQTLTLFIFFLYPCSDGQPVTAEAYAIRTLKTTYPCTMATQSGHSRFPLPSARARINIAFTCPILACPKAVCPVQQRLMRIGVLSASRCHSAEWSGQFFKLSIAMAMSTNLIRMWILQIPLDAAPT